MFKEPNAPGFESVGYSLLMIIDPEECKRNIPWPLINDKAQAREFRTNFTKFIKMINTKYPDAKIPELNASSLQYPGGPRFLNFIYKLSTFALELELKKTLSPSEKENLLPKSFFSNITKDQTDQKVKLKIVKSALSRELESLLQFRAYEAEAPIILMKMDDCLNNITTQYKTVSEQLKLAVSSLDYDDESKARLVDIEDCSVIAEYNERVENKLKELEENIHNLSQIDKLAEQCHQASKASQSQGETLCLDGHKLGFNRFLNELAGGPIVNVDGDVKLLEVLRAGNAAVNGLLMKSPSSTSLLSPAQDLQALCKSTASGAYKAEAALKRLLLENKQAVSVLRPIIDSNLTKKNIPDFLKCLKERPPLKFVLPQSADKENSIKPGRKRKSFGTVITRKNTVACTFKTKREPKKHVSSTPFFKTPACRKSLYNTLPSGTRQKRKSVDKTFELTPDNLTPLSPAVSFKQESIISEPSPIFSCTTNETSLPQPVLPTRCGRKSLNDIVQRYLKLKQSMCTSSNSKNESDTCDETGG